MVAATVIKVFSMVQNEPGERLSAWQDAPEGKGHGRSGKTTLALSEPYWVKIYPTPQAGVVLEGRAMSLYEELFQISKLLLAEEDDERTPEVLLRRILEKCGAETGFVVVRENGSFERKLTVGYDGEDGGDLARFSRTLVREVIESGEPQYLPDLLDDPRFASAESGFFIGHCCVMVAPLRYCGEVYGVVYLENRTRVDGFSAESRAFLAELAEVAGLFLRRASEREALRRRNRSLETDLFAQ